MHLFGFLITVSTVILNFGNCDTVCDLDRVGPDCQFKNIAYKKQSYHDSNTHPPRYSQLANDDNLSTCSYTSDRNNAAPWWGLWLSEYTTVKKLEFVTVESHLSHFPYFEVLVYNTTEFNSEMNGSASGGQVCYKYNSSIPQSTKIHITCKGYPVGILLRLQLHSKRYQLVLCDFRLYGDCFNGFYGNDCQKCSDSCKSWRHRYCNSENGHCLKGCKPGWTGDLCETKCVNDKWGQDCLGKCGKCDNLTCDHITAKCPRGCSSGFKPPYCTRECDDGFFGKNCQDRCNNNCLTQRASALCDQMNGTCLNGCKAGYQGSQCSIKCDDGKWGINCTNDCGKCLTSTCNHLNGYCQDGCAAGYKKTWDCLTKCEDGTYGNSCLFNCSDNCKGICNRINGTCDQCRQFWTGHFCEKVSDKILSDTEVLARYQEILNLKIVLICVGILCAILVVYATVITVLFKRKTTKKEKEETGSSFSGRNHGDSNENKTNKTETVTNEAATEVVTALARVNINAIDDELHQYTEPTPDTEDVEATYETIQLE